MSEDILGKRLKHKAAPDSEAAKVVRVGDEWVDFDNKSSVLKEKIKENFVEIRSEINDAEAFLENSTTLTGIMNQIKHGQKGGVSVPDGDGLSIRNNMETVELSNTSRPLEMDESQMLAAAKAAREEQTARNLKMRMEQEAWAREQGILDDDGGEEIVINADQYLKEKTPLAGQKSSVAQQQTTQPHIAEQYTTSTKPVAAVSQQVNPVAAIFESMKRPNQVKIQFELLEKIPKLEAIRNFEDMFNFDIVETLAVEITDRVLKNPKLIEEAIRKQLELLIRPKKKKKLAAKKRLEKDTEQLREDDTEHENE